MIDVLNVNLDESSNLSRLETLELYTRYFDQLEDISHRFLSWYKDQRVKEEVEAIWKQAVVRFSEVLMNTHQALRLKYAYHPSELMNIDMSDSGFPNKIEILNLEVEWSERGERLKQLPSHDALKTAIIDYLFHERELPMELFWQLGMREYLSYIDSHEIFRTFTSGDLFTRDVENGKGRYVYTWGCYDMVTNRPYYHMLIFDEDYHARESIEERGPMHQHFLDVLRAHGSRVPLIETLAKSIDEALEYIHPRVVRRIGLGPIYGHFSNGAEETAKLYENSKHVIDDGFILVAETETIISASEEITNVFFGIGGKKLQKFHVNVANSLARSRRASAVQLYMFAPHRLLQHLAGNDELKPYTTIAI